MNTHSDTVPPLVNPSEIVDSVVQQVPETGLFQVSQQETETHTDNPRNFFNTTFTPGMPVHEKTSLVGYWVGPFLLLLFFAISILFAYFRKELKILLASFFKKETERKLYSEENILMRRTLWVLVINFLLVTPVLIYQTIMHTGYIKHVFPTFIPLYFQLLLLITVLFVAKILLVRFLGELFLCIQDTETFLRGIFLMLGISGLISIPACLTIQYAPISSISPLIAVSWSIVGVSYLTGLISGFVSSLKGLSISKYHLFLYFCTLELLPALLVIKVIRIMAIKG